MLLTVSDSKLSRLNRSKLTLRLKKLKQKINQNQKSLLQKKNLMLIVSLRQSVGKKVDISRIVYRDAQTYFSVLLDDNNRKPICRMYFNTATKYVATIDENKKDVKHVIESLDDIYNYEDEFFKAIDMYEHKE